MVAGGLGVAVVSESYRGLFAEQVCYREFAGSSPEIPLYVIRAADNVSRSAELFLSTLKNNHRA